MKHLSLRIECTKEQKREIERFRRVPERPRIKTFWNIPPKTKTDKHVLVLEIPSSIYEEFISLLKKMSMNNYIGDQWKSDD